MTLILGLANTEQAILVSDRRLTRNGQLVDDESNKAAVLTLRDARLAVAYTGLAEQGVFRTGRWLLEALMESAAPDFRMAPTIGRFRDRASRDFATIAVSDPSHKRLSVFLIGYAYSEGPPRCYFWLVSNFDDCKSSPRSVAASSFDIASHRERRPVEEECDLLFIGGTHVVPPDAIAAMRSLLKARKPARAIVAKAVETVHRAADSPAARGGIGKQCTSIILPSDPQKEATAEYHTSLTTSTVYGVSLIEARGGDHGALVIGDPEIEYRTESGVAGVLAVPTAGRNSPCPCGSGKKYKRCHGR